MYKPPVRPPLSVLAPRRSGSAERLAAQAASARSLHTLRTIEFVPPPIAEEKFVRPVMSMTVNVHDRYSRMDMLNYSKMSVEKQLPELVKSFRHPTKRKSLFMLVAQATLFTDPVNGRYNPRGGHILGCEVIIPAASEEGPIVIQNVISKLPSGTPSKRADATTPQGHNLAGQDYSVKAQYETDTNAVVFRDSNAAIDGSAKYVAPVFISLIDHEKVGLDIVRLFKNAAEIAQRDTEYVRMGRACGEHIVGAFKGESLTTKGMSVQDAFDIVMTEVAKRSSLPGFRDAVHQAMNELGVRNHPINMCDYGIKLKSDYFANVRAARADENANREHKSEPKGSSTSSSQNRR